MAIILDMPCQDDAATADVDDVSASNNNGGVASGTTHGLTAAGPNATFPKSLAFTGNNFITLTSTITLAPNDPWTIEFAFKNNDTANLNGIAGDREAVGSGFCVIFIDNGGYFRIEDDGGSADTQVLLADSDNDWHAYAVTNAAASGGVCKVYQDGGFLGLGSVSSNLILTTIAAGGINELDLRMIGRVCGLRIHNAERTALEVATYAATLAALSQSSRGSSAGFAAEPSSGYATDLNHATLKALRKV